METTFVENNQLTPQQKADELIGTFFKEMQMRQLIGTLDKTDTNPQGSFRIPSSVDTNKQLKLSNGGLHLHANQVLLSIRKDGTMYNKHNSKNLTMLVKKKDQGDIIVTLITTHNTMVHSEN